MPDPTQFDLDFRPTTYWAGAARAGANIKGTFRREMLQGAAALEGLPPELLAPSLGEDVRAEVGSWHPAFMGGEYLPDHEDNEVTIARVELESTTGDVIAVRARPMADGIGYRVVDEYETPFTCSPTSSSKPLTLGELIGLIDTVTDGERTGLTTAFRELGGVPEDLEGMAHFVHVVSDFYPQLEAWYDAEASEWFERRLAERRAAS